MNTKKSKRWNGALGSLAPDFLKDVIEKMEAYGDTVQFELPGKAKRPHYQVINKAGKKMGFDSKNLLLRLNQDGNISDGLSAVFTLDAVKAALNPAPAASRPRTARVAAATRSRPSVTAQAVDDIERDKYAYFKNHRETLPAGIETQSAKISELMRGGLSAEAAFDAIVAQMETEPVQ